MSEYKGKAGRIYTEKSDEVDNHQWEVWFEDFCILGTGSTELEALKNAREHAADIARLITDAIGELVTTNPHHAASGGSVG